MDPVRPSGVGRSAIGKTAAAEPGPWQVGQHLRALVLRGTPPEAGGGDALVQIGRHAVRVRAHLPLVQGDHLAVQVARLRPAPVLRLIEPLTQGPHAEAATQAATRVLLPRQTGLPQLFAVLTAADARPPEGSPPELRAAVQRLLAGLLKSSQAGDPAALRRALVNAGFTFEARTAAGRPTGGDLKHLIMQLLKAAEAADPPPAGVRTDPAQPPPPRRDGAPAAQPRITAQTLDLGEPGELAGQLRRLAEGALARTALHQMVAADAERAGLFQLHGELPIRDDSGVDVMHFRIEREARERDRDRAKTPWTLMLALDLPGLGPLHARIGIADQAVSTRFWAERESTRRTIERELPSLAAQFERCGLRTGELSCRAGRPPAPADHAETAAGVLDERA